MLCLRTVEVPEHISVKEEEETRVCTLQTASPAAMWPISCTRLTRAFVFWALQRSTVAISHRVSKLRDLSGFLR